MPISLYSTWKQYPEIIGFRKRYKAINENSIILAGTPLHRNLGDHLIAEAEKKFLEDTFPNSNIIEIPTEAFIRNFIFLQAHTPKDTKVFITGGGWMGDMWPKDELTMQQMIRSFSHCKLTILPQTIYYDNTSNKLLLENSKKAMHNCKDIKLCVRDEASYNFAHKYLDMPETILAPDMALYYTTDITSTQTTEAGICLRDDKDKIDSNNVEILKQQLEFEFGVRPIDTIAPQNFALADRTEEIRKALRTFAECPVVLTDRLQGMIFSVLIGTKCIALSTKSGKVAGIYNRWLRWNENIILADQNLDYAKIEQFTCTPYKTTRYPEVLKPEFDKLKNLIK